jgi:hypothetical protein
MIALGLVSGHSFALDTAALVDGHAAALLKKKCIETETCGVLPARFDAVARYLSQPDLVQRIQGEYRRSVSKDGTIDFPIVENGNNTYYYINEKDQRTDLFELYRRPTSDSTFDLVYYAKGKRYFGKYEVLIHIRAIDAGPAGTIYTASVHAYPHNGLMRFFARRFGTVERYFQRKTRLIDRVSNKICIGMDDPLPYAYQSPIPTLRRAQQMSEGPAPRSGPSQLWCPDQPGPRQCI